jgi:hypothetical protein
VFDIAADDTDEDARPARRPTRVPTHMPVDYEIPVRPKNRVKTNWKHRSPGTAALFARSKAASSVDGGVVGTEPAY